jgi:hypothetical protein
MIHGINQRLVLDLFSTYYLKVRTSAQMLREVVVRMLKI